MFASFPTAITRIIVESTEGCSEQRRSTGGDIIFWESLGPVLLNIYLFYLGVYIHRIYIYILYLYIIFLYKDNIYIVYNIYLYFIYIILYIPTWMFH